jgi:hypothetical protein
LHNLQHDEGGNYMAEAEAEAEAEEANCIFLELACDNLITE